MKLENCLKRMHLFFQIITPATNTIVAKLSVGRTSIYSTCAQQRSNQRDTCLQTNMLNLVDFRFIGISFFNSVFSIYICTCHVRYDVNSCKLGRIKTLWIFCYSLSFVSNCQFVYNKATFSYRFKLFKGFIQLSYFFVLCVYFKVQKDQFDNNEQEEMREICYF